MIVGSRALLAERARLLGLDVELDRLSTRQRAQPRRAGRARACSMCRWPRPASPAASTPPTRATCSRCSIAPSTAPRSGEFDAMVTAPVQKSVINDAGVPFTGHTEYLAARTGAAHPVMLLAADDAARGARHHAPAAARGQRCDHRRRCSTPRCAIICTPTCSRLWGMSRPRIAVCGLNPHAGESGHLGTEDRDVIAPAIERARAAGMLVDGPMPADTVFVPRALSNYDVVLAMYHDQGLPVLKHAGFGHAVNVTLGLPIMRTSVDHGTALDLAGTGRADAGSLVAATQLAIEFAGETRS